MQYAATIPPSGTDSNLWGILPNWRWVDGILETILIYDSGLINGHRRFNNSEPLPLTVFNVTKGDRYLFRVVNSGGEYALQLSVH